MALTSKKTAGVSLALMLGSLGVVFGDIGTGPLYALKVAFGLPGMAAYSNDPLVVKGLLSLLIWTVTIIVSVKYVGFVMRASNKGEGGIMALVALIGASKIRRRVLLTALGLVGVALFYGDGVVTPAISVLSAAEGLHVIAPDLGQLIVPGTLLALSLLFYMQRYGTNLIGRIFGPVMFIWFVTIGLGGAWQVSKHPDILQALLPTSAFSLAIAHPMIAFVAMAAVILAVTGAETLYADMGHFGRPPIARAWFLLVFPALALCYLGQGALVLYAQYSVSNPFYELFPHSLRVPVLAIATAAALIASQAVISGAFSLTRQAIQLGFLPRMTIRQTSERSFGQIYLPLINGLMFTAVVLLVLFFGSAAKLAGAYGVAVSGTLCIDTILFLVVMHHFWKLPRIATALCAAIFLAVDITLIAATATKIPHGGWLPLALAASIVTIIWAWIAGQRVATKQRRAHEPRLERFIRAMQDKRRHQITRLPGQAVYIGHHPGLVPTALRNAVEELHELHEKAVIVYVETSTSAHVPPEERASFDALGYADGISQVTTTYGFHDTPNIPKALENIRHISPELDFDPYKAEYFISLNRIVVGRHQRHGLFAWQKALYGIMSRNALSTSDYYHLPIEKTMEMRSLIQV